MNNIFLYKNIYICVLIKMNKYCFLFMEDYKIQLYSRIAGEYCSTIEEVEQKLLTIQEFIVNGVVIDSVILNRNKEGKLHSKYLEDRYEPAVIRENLGTITKFYLFDGDIKDCVHPFCTYINFGKLIGVTYYSSKRIEDNLPINMHREYEYYNLYERPFDEVDEELEDSATHGLSELDSIVHGFKTLMEGYNSYITKEYIVKQFTELHEEMISGFKFAD